MPRCASPGPPRRRRNEPQDLIGTGPTSSAEPAFPGILAYNERPTADDVVRIEMCSHDNPVLTAVMDGRDDPQW